MIIISDALVLSVLDIAWMLILGRYRLAGLGAKQGLAVCLAS